jgi:hypothetical protein
MVVLNQSCERRKSRTAARSQAGAERQPLRAERGIKYSDVRAADLQEEMAEQRFSVPSAPTKTAAT